jgi:hypothetical protein
MRTCSLAVSVIGQGLALARGLETKHAVKQVDRMLSNPGLNVDALLPHWVSYPGLCSAPFGRRLAMYVLPLSVDRAWRRAAMEHDRCERLGWRLRVDESC